MRNYKKTLTYVIIALLLVAIAFFIGMTKAKNDLKPNITNSLIQTKLEDARELTTTKYRYTNMGSFENQSTFYGYKIPFTGKKFILTYDGMIHAGVDLSRCDLDIQGKKIKIALPPAQILSHEIFEDSLQIFDEKTSIFNPIKVEDYANFSQDQKQKMEEQAIKKGLLQEAEKRAKQTVEDIFHIDTFLQEYEIEVTQKSH